MVNSQQGKKQFIFDRVFEEDTGQQDIWDYVSDSVNSFIQGYNVSILNAGQFQKLLMVCANFPDGYLKHLPIFNGEIGSSTEDHIAAFLNFADNMNIEHENIYMRLFVQSLEGNVRI